MAQHPSSQRVIAGLGRTSEHGALHHERILEADVESRYVSDFTSCLGQVYWH